MNNPDLSSLEKQATDLRDQGKSDEAVAKYQELKKMYLESGELVKAAGMQQMIGICYKIAGESDKARDAFNEALEDYKKSGDKLGPGRVARDVAISYMNDDQLEDADKYFAQSRQLLESQPSDSDKHQSVEEWVSRDSELGITLAKIGALRTKQGRLDEAEKEIMDGLVLIRKAGHPSHEVTAMIHLAGIYFITKHYGRALSNLEAALGLLYEHGLNKQHSRRMGEIWAGLAHSYLQLGNKATAKHFAQKSLDYINGLGEGEQKLLRKLIQADELEKLL